MKKIKIIAACIAVIFAVIIAMIFFYFDGQKAVSTKSKEIVVEVSGSASNVLDQFDFKANVYVLNQNMDLKTILKIIEGDNDYISTDKVTILEGYTIPECAKQVAKVANIEVDTTNLNDDQILELKTNKDLETWTN